MQAFCASLVLFALSLLLPSDTRPVVWAIALLIEFAAPLIATRKATGAPIHEEHFQERYAFFTIIVLGETFVKTLTEIGGRGISIETQVFGGLTFLILIAIWLTYFDDVADRTFDPPRGCRRRQDRPADLDICAPSPGRRNHRFRRSCEEGRGRRGIL